MKFDILQLDNRSFIYHGEIEDTNIAGFIKIKNSYTYTRLVNKNYRNGPFNFLQGDYYDDPENYPDWTKVFVYKCKFKMPTLDNPLFWTKNSVEDYAEYFDLKIKKEDFIIPISKIQYLKESKNV